MHNALQIDVDGLANKIEALVVKLYPYFYMYTVRVTQLKKSCENSDVESRNLIQHGRTRLLSLLHIRRIEIFSRARELSRCSSRLF